MDNIMMIIYSDFIFAPMAANAWALLNLMLVVVGIFLALMALIDHVGGNRRKKREEKTRFIAIQPGSVSIAEKEKHIWRNKLDWLVAAEILGLFSVLMFLLTQNMNNIMVLMNWMTIAHIIIFIVEIVALRFVYLGEKV